MAGVTTEPERWSFGADARWTQALFSISRDALLVVRHADHRILAASASAQRLYVRSEEQLRQLCYDELVSDQRIVADIFDRHRDRVPLRFHLRADSSRFPVEMEIHWQHDAGGAEVGLFRIRDLTRSEAEERRLRAVENSHQAIFRAAPFPILLLDRRGMISDANDAALALYRHSSTMLIGLPMSALLQDERVARRYFRAARWQDSGQRHRRSDGSTFLADVSVSIVRLSIDLHAIVVVHDVTEERELLERLQASEARWRFALEGHGDSLWEWDLLHGRFHVSREMSEQLGRSPQPDAPPIYWSGLVHPGDRTRLYRALISHIKGEAPLIDIELRLQSQSGCDRWVWLRGRVMERNAAGRPLRLIGSVRDVHDQKQQAEELAHWREQVQHTARLTSMGEMAATLAHELNQPLTSIRTFSAAALRRLDGGAALQDPVELRRIVQLIADEAMRAGGIMQHVRNFVRKGRAQVEPVLINEVVQSVQRLAEIQARRIGATIQLVLDIGLPRVRADRVLVEQLLLNLVRNGLDAMRQTEGERNIVISTSSATGKDDAVEVCVRDQGSGLPADLAEDIYTPFYTTKDDGLGMGLAICRSIIESHHGRLWAEANPGGGTAFHFTLPMAQETDHDRQAPRVRRR